jgi:hypothetical protein
MISSQAISGFVNVANDIPALPNPSSLPTQSQSTDDPYWYSLFPKDTEDIDFEKDFGIWFNPEEDIPLLKEGPFSGDNDFDQWWTEADFDWYDNNV